MANHELKTVQPYWQHVESGAKRFEVRYDDRGYSIGDTLVLLETDSGGPTGNVCTRVVQYILPGGDFGVLPGYVVLGLCTVAEATRLRQRGALPWT